VHFGPSLCSVVRLVGNHELMWLQGNFRYAHPQSDNQTVTDALIGLISNDILAGRLQAALAPAQGQLLATHAGLRPEMLALLLEETAAKGDRAFSADSTTAQVVAEHINRLLREAVERCIVADWTPRKWPKQPIRTAPLRCTFEHEVFNSGPERGGVGIGGTFWTDFSQLKGAGGVAVVPQLLQIVGHSASPCDVATSAECAPVRVATDLSVIDVDVAMVHGNRGYLELTAADGFIAHTLRLPVSPRRAGRRRGLGSAAQRDIGRTTPNSTDVGVWERRMLHAEACPKVDATVVP
jgi:hypothetical protein